MKPGSLVTAALVLLGTAICVRLGFWQLSRLHEKRELNAGLRAALAAPAVRLGLTPLAVDSVRGRRVVAQGRYDQARQVLLSGRSHDGSPGVDVVTPLLLAGDSVAVLVDRGWLPSDDAAHAWPQRYPESGAQQVLGIAEPMRRGAGGGPFFAFEADTVMLLSTRWLDLDSLASRFPYRLAAYALRQLPDPALPARPRRLPPRAFDETMHLSYAIQWFLFGLILLGGSLAVALQRRRGPQPESDLSIPPTP